jgi:hypothetical protein
VIEAVPEDVGRKVEVHVADAVVPDNVQVVKDPDTPVSLKATVPVGATKVPKETSVTVTVQAEAWLATTGVAQLMAVVVDRRLTTMLVVPVLPL